MRHATAKIMRRGLIALSLTSSSVPLVAQVRPTTADRVADYTEDQERPQLPAASVEIRPSRAGRVADSTVGEAGQRQTREAVRSVRPIGRVAGRIQNRVQSRIRNRMDRDYDPQANATSPFRVAEEETRAAGRPR